MTTAATAASLPIDGILIRPDFNAIPAELKALPQWVLWSNDNRKGSRTKTPRQKGGWPAETDNEKHTIRFDLAQRVYEHLNHSRFSGVGAVILNGFVGIDLDKCRDPISGEMHPKAIEIIRRVNSYAEVSPTGTGVKIWTRGRLEATTTVKGFFDTPDSKLEMHVYPRYYTVTGMHFEGTPLAIVEDQEAIDATHAELLEFRQKQEAAQRSKRSPRTNGRGRIASNGRPATDKTSRILAYLKSCPPAIQGQDGSGTTLAVARAVVWGFDVDPETALGLMADWNASCVPPWEIEGNDGLRRKLEEVERLPFDKPRGYLLASPPSRYGSSRNGGATNGHAINGHASGGSHQAGPLGGSGPTSAGDGNNGHASTKDEELLDDREEILITPDEAAVNNAIIEALGRHDGVFQRGNCLVGIARASSPRGAKKILRPEGTPTIAPLKPSTIREKMTECCVFFIEKEREGELVQIRRSPPHAAAMQIHDRREWNGIRHLEGIAETPLFLDGGRILSKPGYDDETGLYLAPNVSVPPVPDKPTRDEAIAAATALLDLVEDFPFAAAHHKAAWLASLLTVFARHAIAGPLPLFLFNANTAGAGKTRLVHIVSIALTGRATPCVAWPSDDDELRKSLLAIATAGDAIVLFDNVGVGQTLGGPALDAALTSTHIKGRLLGVSQTVEVPYVATTMATGNNVVLAGDTERRTIHSRLLSQVEHPEERTNFRIPRLLDYVQEHRGEIVALVLTILRAFEAAGRPTPSNLPAFGSFESWSDLIRGATIFATDGIDPCEGRDELREANTAKAFLPAFIEGLAGLACFSERGATAQDIVRELTSADVWDAPNPHKEFAASIAANVRGGEVTARSLGKLLAQSQDKVADGRILVKDGTWKGFAVWKVKKSAG